MAWYRNKYECPCGETWEDEWSCTCNDRCPSCNKEIEPDDSDDLTVIVKEEDGIYCVYRSPEDADDDPAYENVGAFKYKEDADACAERFSAMEDVKSFSLN